MLYTSNFNRDFRSVVCHVVAVMLDLVSEKDIYSFGYYQERPNLLFISI